MSPELDEIRREAERLTSLMAPRDWRHAPPGKWNCAQVLEHLRLSYTGTTEGTLRAMEIGRPLGRKPTLRDRIGTFYVAGLGLFPSGRTAPAYTVPAEDRGVGSLRAFSDALVAMDATLTHAEKRFGRNARLLDHPVLGPLTAQQWRRFHRTHARHHMKQVAQHVKCMDPGQA